MVTKDLSSYGIISDFQGVPKPYLMRERIMPAIVTATVVRWKLVAEDTKDEFAKFVSDKEVSVYVRDDGEDADVSADVSAVISEYVIDAAEKGENAIELLKLARDGLLRVVGITRAPVTPPPTR
jgi:hypothetical protein